jgi:NAD+ diphosphatase
MRFIASFIPAAGHSGPELWFIFREDGLLVKTAGAGVEVPKASDIAGLQSGRVGRHYLGALDGVNCYASDMDEESACPDGMSFMEMRMLFGIFDDVLAGVASRAFQVLHWERTHQFCGRCGCRTEAKTDERARICPQCGLINYPELSPAIIVAVIRGKEIILARSKRFRYAFYSVLAGFVEPGETFEETVKREVKEEVGIEVKNIRYFGSQPWPFPNSVMVGFIAEYESGEIRIDGSEITEAAWFSADNLPAVPRKGSISRSLIDYFINSRL